VFKFVSKSDANDGKMTLFYNDQPLMYVNVTLIDDYADMTVRAADDALLAFWIEDLKEKQDV